MSSENMNGQPGDTHKRNVAAFFSQSTRYWSEVYSSSGHEGESFDAYAKTRRKRLVLELLDRHAGGRKLALLDVGCGPGLFLEEAACRGHKVYGVDLSEEMVREANGRLEAHVPGRTPCVQGDIESLPFESNSMDVVLCLGVLPYLRDDGTGVAEMERVLKDGGFGIVIMPNLIRLGNLFDPYYYLVRGWQYLWYRRFRVDAANGRSLEPEKFGTNSMFGIRRYTASQISSLFRHSSFTVEETKGIDYGPFTFWRRRFMPDRISTAVSELLVGMEQRTARSWVTGIANEWVLRMTVSKRLEQGA